MTHGFSPWAWWRASWQQRPDGRYRTRRYLLAALLGCVALWSVAIGSMIVWPRTWAVEFTLIIPNGDPDARVDLREVGQAYATKGSTYDSKSLDPRVNYREILLSDDVVSAAASAVGLEPDKFGEPRIKLIDQSSVMELRVTGKSAQVALDKAHAINQAFQDRLTALRHDELAQRERAIEQAVRTSREKLEAAQRELLRFKVDAHLVSEKQLDEMAMDTTQLQRRLIELNQRLARDRATVTSLTQQLGIPARLAGWTLTLQGDAVFQEYFRQYASAAGQLASYAHKWEDGHPKVREASGQRDSSFNAMRDRARVVLSEPVTQADLRRMAMVLQDRGRDLLLREMVSAQSSADSAQAEIAEISRQRDRLAQELPRLASESAQLDELQRRVNFLEAVFTGAVGKTDVGLANVFSSYPMVQTLVAPSLPQRPASPRASYIGAGAVVASLLLLVGLSLAWLRNKRETPVAG